MPDDFSCTMQLSGYEVLCINSLLNSVKENKVRKKIPEEFFNVFVELKNRFYVEVKNYENFKKD